MENIIQHFLEKIYSFNNFSSMISLLDDNLNNFVLNLLKYILENLDDNIKLREKRKKNWDIIRINTRTIHTAYGKLTFNHTYYRNKNTRRYAYLLDKILKIKKYSRIDDLLKAKIAMYTSEFSFEKAGLLACENDKISKQTVKNLVHEYYEEAIKTKKLIKKEKRVVKTLYIEADEDHISLQREDKKSGINKLIYVHEGRVEESKGRNFLKNKYIFASHTTKSEDLWIEVYQYLDDNYDLEKLENIFVLGDGANWIKNAPEWITGAISTLDGFHLNKGILKLSGTKNKELYEQLKEYVYSLNKIGLIKCCEEIIELEIDEKKKEKKQKELGYLKNQWKSIENYVNYKDKYNLRCSAEGNVSHILASRMSSRPMGWSRAGIEALTKLRVDKLNGIKKEEIIEIFKNSENKKEKEKEKKFKEKIKIKELPRVTQGSFPVINIGEVNGSYCAIKNYL